jgi:hypothetical protein
MTIPEERRLSLLGIELLLLQNVSKSSAVLVRKRIAGRELTISSTTEGSARVDRSPSWSASPAEIFLKLLGTM